MPRRNWHPVYKSPHKIVLVKPRPHRPHKHHHHTTHHHTTTHVQKDMDLSWLWPLVQIIVGILMLIFVVDLLITAWPYLLIAAILFVVIAACG